MRPIQGAPVPISAHPSFHGQHVDPPSPATFQPEPCPATLLTLRYRQRASLGPTLNKTQILKRMVVALRRDTRRNKINRVGRQSTLPAHWPTLISPSLPIRPVPRPTLSPSPTASTTTVGNLTRTFEFGFTPHPLRTTHSNTLLHHTGRGTFPELYGLKHSRGGNGHTRGHRQGRTVAPPQPISYLTYAENRTQHHKGPTPTSSAQRRPHPKRRFPSSH